MKGGKGTEDSFSEFEKINAYTSSTHKMDERKSVSESDFSRLYQNPNQPILQPKAVASLRSLKIKTGHGYHGEDGEYPLSTISEYQKRHGGSLKSSSKNIFKFPKKMLPKPKKWASCLFTRNQKQQYVSAEDFSTFLSHHQNHKFSLSDIDKTQSLERGRKLDSEKLKYHQYPDNLSTASLPGSGNLFEEQISLVESLKDCVQKLKSERNDDQLENVREEISKCKNETEKLKDKLREFQKEFRHGINTINQQLKEDEDRYTKLCYQLDHITEWHQLKINHVTSLVQNFDIDSNRIQDKIIFEVLYDKIETLEKRLLKL